ncbi:Predicted hydrolase of the alpha/beta-hydrolase fold [uncultured Clostridium sp.]|uniref:alpha/beta hydrolase n=1 Tax=uncultured Clostridium sp. TaxID=59620 RepID=UPI000820A063|nr:alpha/beta hydrolase [uncultured Clostridium sp.]MDU2672253.1 alpha/beta hydrolase [Clostridium sp.]SCJ72602.1 Predicted hydrolase of the alpha/beta-hydrolase fold [uncultured Clostridium sp.]
MITFIIISLFIIVLFLLICYSYKLCKIVVYPKKKSYEDGYENQIKKLNLEDFYNSLEKEEITLKSDYGYDIKGIFIPNSNSNKCIILCHGITVNTNYSVKYIKPFYSRGFSIFMYDHRNHGLSGGNYTSMGYFEKFDLKTCANYIFNKLGDDISLGVLGESMGAATVLQYCAIDKRIDFCIEDCGYSDVFNLFKHRLKEDYKINFTPLLYIANILMRFKYGWNFKSASPITFIKNIDIPVLFIHGDKDDYVPTYMVYDLFNSKTTGFKDIYIAKDAKHADALISDPNKYDAVIGNFLDKVKMS